MLLGLWIVLYLTGKLVNLYSGVEGEKIYDSIKDGLKDFLYDTDSVIFGLIILGILFSFDIATTEIILSNGGYEMNIFMKSVVASEIFHIAVKLSVLSVIAGAVFYSNKRLKNSGTITLALIIIFYLVTVIHNLGSVSALI